MEDPKILKLEKEIKKSRSNMTRYRSSNYNYNHTGSNIYLQEPIQLDNVIDNSNGYLEAGDNYSIKVKAGVHHINIKASIMISSNQGSLNYFYIYIRKNGENVSVCSTTTNILNSVITLSIFRDYLEVEEGDTIQFYFAADNTAGGIEGSMGLNVPKTQMSIQVVD